MNMGAVVAVCLLLAAACWTDLRTMRIPNRLNLVFAACGVVYQFASHGIRGLAFAFLGAAAGVIPLFVLYLLRGMGGGDVKWFGAFGAWMGASATLQLMMYAIVTAGLIASMLLLLRLPLLRRWGGRIKWPWGRHPVTEGKGAMFPFMLAVAPSFIWLISTGG